MISILNKKKIQQSFDKASISYDKVASIQKHCAQFLTSELVKNFPSFSPSSILDIGTGTGYIPEYLLKVFPKSLYSLNDIAPKMLAKTKLKLGHLPNFNFHLGDMESLDFDNHQLVISNLALQWTNDIYHMIEKLYNKSDVLAFSCLLSGTFEEWSNIFSNSTSHIPLYPSQIPLESFIVSLLKPQNYFFKVQDFEMEFKNPLAFMIYLKKLGANNGSREISFRIIRNLIKTNKQKIRITYKVFFGILKRV